MSSCRAIVAAVINATACVLLVWGSAGAQTCSINSSAPGPVSCSVTASVRMTVRIPALVGVTVTSVDDAAWAASVVHAGVKVKTNRSYALQIASAPIDPTDPTASTSLAQPSVLWSTATGRALLSETPTQLDDYGETTRDGDPVQVAFARMPQSSGPALEPIRFVLTIVAP